MRPISQVWLCKTENAKLAGKKNSEMPALANTPRIFLERTLRKRSRILGLLVALLFIFAVTFYNLFLNILNW